MLVLQSKEAEICGACVCNAPLNQFQNPCTTSSRRKVRTAERKKRKQAINSGHFVLPATTKQSACTLFWSIMQNMTNNFQLPNKINSSVVFTLIYNICIILNIWILTNSCFLSLNRREIYKGIKTHKSIISQSFKVVLLGKKSSIQDPMIHYYLWVLVIFNSTIHTMNGKFLNNLKQSRR